MENRYSLILDFKQSSFTNIKFVQNDIDTSVLEFMICNQGVPVNLTDQVVTFAFLKSDQTLVLQDVSSGVSTLDATNGKIECILKSQTLAAVGIVKAEISFSDVSGKKLSTAQFNFTVTASIDNGEGILSSNQITVIDAKLLDIQAQYNDDSTQWNSDVNNKIAEATNKIAETEVARQGAITATNNTTTAITNAQNATTLANNTVTTINNNTYTNPKGIKTTYALLPSSGNVLGDSWHVTSDSDTTKNGHWRWNGTAWVLWYQFNLSGVPNTASLNDIDKAKADIIRNQRHSGCLRPLPFVTGSTTNLNSITVPADTYSINGYEVSVPQTVVTFDAPPTTSKRTDLVFLEFWFPQNGNGYTLSYRFRTQSGVNITTYPEGVNDTVNVKAWGGNSANTTYTFALDSVDKGIFKSGDGSTTAKNALLTFDGYVYGVGICANQRRNSSGFSPSNPNGARGYVQSSVTASSFAFTAIGVRNQVQISNTSLFKVGDIVYRNNDASIIYIAKIISIDSANLMTIEAITAPNVWNVFASYSLCLLSDHPQSLYSNVIDSRDITDLRHETKSQYNYDYLLKKADDQFKRGELSLKKMLTVHHGIPKTEVDANTVFYASLDGTTVAEVGGSPAETTAGVFAPTVTGSGYNGRLRYNTTLQISANKTYTIDLWIKDYAGLRWDTFNDILNVDGICTLETRTTAGSLKLCGPSSTTGLSISVSNSEFPLHLRFVRTGTSADVYKNSKFYTSTSTLTAVVDISNAVVSINRPRDSVAEYNNSILSDISISNIDRGSIFPNIPPDFISGDAIIMPAYTDQRRISSEAQMTQTVNSIVKATNTGNSRGVNRVVIGTPSTWSAGDTVTITGMAGELISGVFDTDTAKSTLVKDALSTDTSAYFDIVDTTLYSDGDTVKLVDRVLGTVLATKIINTGGVDATNKKLTFTETIGIALSKYQVVAMEATATSSVPKVYYMNGTTKTEVVGDAVTPWTGMFGNVATFKLGTNASLTNQDLQIDYSMIMSAGQPALSVPTTTTLMGEAGFRLPYANQTITSDFASKVSGRTWENPNKLYDCESNILEFPYPDGTATNIVTNGDFTNGTTGWSNITAIVDGRASKLATAQFASISQLKTTITGNKYYVSADIETDVSSKIYLKFGQGTDAYAYSPTLQKVSSIITATTTSTLLEIGDSRASAWSTYYVDNIIVINLTATFGAGNEPTQGQCNVIFAAWFDSSSPLSVPANTTIIEVSSQTDIDKIKTQDGISYTVTTSENGKRAQVPLILDVIKIVERKLGCKIPAKTTAEKATWMKNNISTMTCKVYCHGSSPTGNKASVSYYTSAAFATAVTNTQSTPTLTTLTISPSYISPTGTIYAIAYADASDGITPSVINVDYASLDIKFSDKIVICSENSIGTSSSIVLSDDFASKLKGDVASNPNIIRYKEGTIASRNTEFVPGTGTEIESTSGAYNYSGLSKLDATLSSYATSTSGKGAGYIISYNAISEFEQKYGSISAIDKVAYLKSNLGTIVGNVWTYGSLASGGNSATFAVWNSVALTFTTIGSVNTTSAVTKISGGSASVSIANMIDSSGWVHFLIHSAASDETASTIFVDYCSLDLSLASGMYPSGYDILIPKSLRRDSGLANVMVINKQTKEMQTLFNWSNEYNLTTYSEYVPSPSPITSSTDVTIVRELSNWVICDISSSVGGKFGNHPWSGLTYKIGQDSTSLYGEFGISQLGFAEESINLNTGALVNLNTGGFTNNYTKQYGLTAISKPMVGIGRWLVMYNSQLYLLVFSKLVTNGVLNTDNTGQIFLVSLTGNPLIKMDNGLVRSGVITPTTFKTNGLTIQGFVDKATNKLITT